MVSINHGRLGPASALFNSISDLAPLEFNLTRERIHAALSPLSYLPCLWLINESIDPRSTCERGTQAEGAILLRLIFCSLRFLACVKRTDPEPWPTVKEEGKGGGTSPGIFTTSQGHKVVLSLCSWFSSKDGTRTRSSVTAPYTGERHV